MLDVGFSMAQLELILLIFMRMTGLFILSPIFGQRTTPAVFKIGFAFFLTIIFINTINVTTVEYSENIYQYALLVIKELAVGMVIGYITYAIMSSLYLAGQIIDMQIGFGIANVIDPLTNIQVPLTSNFYYIYTILIFLMLNGHHMIIEALFSSFQVIPVESIEGFNINFIPALINLMTEILIIAIRIAAPILVAILISDIVLGVLSRTIPEMNVFILGMPIKIIVGFLIMTVTVGVGVGIAQGIVTIMQAQISTFLATLGGV
jgi:flagellar biosynthetic protein FliR